MIRLVATLVSAILMSRPSMPKAEAAHYARTLNEVAKENDFDPLLAVAIIHFETRWTPNLISPDGEDYGLGQVRARFHGGCRDDADPLRDPSAGCLATKASLLDGDHNLRVMGSIIAANRDLCEDKTGTAKPSQWLAGYQGRNFPERGKWCQPGEKTWRVISYHQELLDRLLPKPKPPKAKAAPPKAKPQPPAKNEPQAPAKSGPQAPAKGAPLVAAARRPVTRVAARAHH